MRYLELNSIGEVVNIVIWDGVSPYSPEGISQLLPCDEHPGISFGWQLVHGEWVDLRPKPEPETTETEV